VYIDQEMALLARKDPAAAVKDVRKLFQRASSVQLPPRAMQQLMARFLKFEQTHGTAADVQNVKEAAQRYVQDRLAAASGVVNDETETGRRGGAAAAASSFGGGDADDDNNLLLDNAGPEEEQFDF
jgi:hypothetical protein